MNELTVFTARAIRTMNPSLPLATAVAVRGDRIVEVGSLETLRPWLEAHPYRIDGRFADLVLMPGFIDPHLHPSMAALLLPMHFVTAMEWRLPWQSVAPVRGHNAFLDRLKDLDQSIDDPAEPMFTWGHHPIWHGEVDRTTLNGISAERPIIVWHRGFHSLIVNDATLRWMGLDMAEAERHPQVDLAKGSFFETGLALAFRHFNPYTLAPERFVGGLERLRQVVHHGGHTTIGDMAAGMFDLDMEWDALVSVLDREDTPFRVLMVPPALALSGAGRTGSDAVERVRGLTARNTHRLRFTDHIKLFADGGFFSGLMQLQEPGRIGGGDGEWMTPPETFEAAARAFWNEGYKIHVHCSADLGVELALDVLEKLQWERPRFNHRFTIEHFGVSTPEQVRRMADLGALASVNIYYVHELSDAYWKHVLGYERASQMSRLGTLARHGITLALHSDFTMAPALPLNNAWVAANRICESGEVMAAEERLTLDQALRAVTIDAAYILGMEHEVGSIRAGKKADFTVLEQDPYEVPVENLKDIPLWGTVFEGRPFPIEG
ncbi:MAG: amidohydrolase [Alphaproteobacteria bacterium]|nr:amidohydrolase [Alphaproteobacteria bacterium]MDP6813596.1 amidohydrolase [Alphaproteobacteria bacterium]